MSNIGGPASALTYEERVYFQLKKDIITCAIAPATRLTEAWIAEHYGFGRAAVRSALKMLSQDSFVESLPRYGYVVAGPEEHDAKNLFQMQMLLEPEVARLAAGRVNPEALRNADEACARKCDIRSFEDATDWLHTNTKFHELIASYTGNTLMARFVVILFERLERQLYASNCLEETVRRAAHSHPELVEALILGDADTATRLAQAQLSEVHAEIIACFREFGHASH